LRSVDAGGEEGEGGGEGKQNRQEQPKLTAMGLLQLYQNTTRFRLSILQRIAIEAINIINASYLDCSNIISIHSIEGERKKDQNNNIYNIERITPSNLARHHLQLSPSTPRYRHCVLVAVCNVPTDYYHAYHIWKSI
jgi:hypothetical protein